MASEGMVLNRGARLTTDPTEVHRIWPGTGVPPGAESWDWQERTAPVPWGTLDRRYTRNVVIPTITVHRPPAGKANGTAMVVAPGGAFHFLMMDHEGHDMGRWLSGMGVTAFVLKYRLARTPDDDTVMAAFREDMHVRLRKMRETQAQTPEKQMLAEVRRMGEEDGRQALRFVRERAADWGIDGGRVGIAGFSAGGGVTMGATVENAARSRPDFAVAIYASMRADESAPEDAPPLFLVHSSDDPQVPATASVRRCEAWLEAGAPVEMHLFADGGHGYGMTRQGSLSDGWPGLLERWLRERRLLPQ